MKGAAAAPGAMRPADGTQSTPDRYADAPQAFQPVVRITTSLGPIDVRLDPDSAFVTVQNFLNYARSGHYDQTVFHYVEKGQLILGGGFLEDGTPKPAGPPILNEAHNGRKNKQGTIAMARDAAAIDSATSQFFINLEDAPHLDHAGETPADYGYCVFGEVIDGLQVARQIADAPTETRVVEGEELSVPAKTVRIESVKVLR
jgi:cyclophilin family peptidyl-prolyl cis-trans isomerase